jgi:hypothetical protein
MTRPFWMALLFAAALFACQKPAQVPDRIDGLYFADSAFPSSGYGLSKLLLLEQGLFELLDGTELAQRGTFEAHDGLIRLRPVGTGTRVELETTYAVVDGHLLLGVLRHVDGEPHRWTSAALPPEVLGQAWMESPHPAGFRIDWDMREGAWRFTSGARHVELSGVARLENPADGGRSFVPVFRRPAQRGGVDDPAGMLAEKRTAMDMGARFGWEAPPEVPLDWDGELVRLRNGEGSPGMRAADVLRDPFANGRPPPYQRRGDIVVTPWTVDLGPVGLLPVRADPWTHEGTYVSGDEELVVSARPSPGESQGDPYLRIFRHPGEESRCLYVPDARGLVAWKLGMTHPPMDHWDKPTLVVCFALADGRFVRYISSGGCSGATPSSLGVFQRRGGP